VQAARERSHRCRQNIHRLLVAIQPRSLFHCACEPSHSHACAQTVENIAHFHTRARAYTRTRPHAHSHSYAHACHTRACATHTSPSRGTWALFFVLTAGVFPSRSVAYDGEWHHIAVVLGPGPTPSSPAYLAAYWDGERVGVTQSTPLNNVTSCNVDGSCPGDIVRVGGTRVSSSTAGNFSGEMRDVRYYAGGLLDTDAIALGDGSVQRLGAVAPSCQCPLTHPLWVGSPYLQSCEAHFPSTSGEVVPRVAVGGTRFYPAFATDGNSSTQWRSGPGETSAEV
jgi:nitrate reductase NapE component